MRLSSIFGSAFLFLKGSLFTVKGLVFLLAVVALVVVTLLLPGCATRNELRIDCVCPPSTDNVIAVKEFI